MQGSGAVSVSGTGSVTSPYVVSAALNLGVQDSPTIDLTVSGDGSVASPWVISGSAILGLGQLTDVITAGAATGQVLAKQADGTYKFVAASTAPVGTINLSSTGGLQGDGSAGSPLSIKLPGSSGLILDATGLRVSGGGAWTTYTSTITATTTNPALGNGTIEAAYSQQGKTVTVSIALTIGSTTTRGVGYWMFSLPVAPVSRWQVLNVGVVSTTVGVFAGSAWVQGNTRVERCWVSTSTAAQGLAHNMPSSFPAGSKVIITGSYEAA